MAIRFCPQLFALRDGDQGAELRGELQQDPTMQLPFQLPYRMVFAMATLDSIIIYDTQVVPGSQHTMSVLLSVVSSASCKSQVCCHLQKHQVQAERNNFEAGMDFTVAASITMHLSHCQKNAAIVLHHQKYYV